MNELLLEEIGMTKGEIKVYLTLLKIGESTTGRIIDEAEISGGKVYEILEKLIKKGLASYIVKEKTRYFSAATPRRILDYLDEREADLKDKRLQLEQELPQLLGLQQFTRKKYETRIYLGLKGMTTVIYEALDAISPNDDILIMGVKLSRDKKFNIMWKKWHMERVRKSIPARILFSEKDKEFFKIFSSMNLTESRILTGITPSSIGILGRMVLISTYGEEPSCLSIIHEEIAASFSTFFWNLWKMAKP